MARLRKPAEDHASISAGVPAELRDHDADVWYDDHLFRAWCVEHLGRALTVREPAGFSRFGAAVTDWAKANGFMDERQPQHVDYNRLRPLGVLQINSRERCQMRDSTIRYTWRGRT